MIQVLDEYLTKIALNQGHLPNSGISGAFNPLIEMVDRALIHLRYWMSDGQYGFR